MPEIKEDDLLDLRPLIRGLSLANKRKAMGLPNRYWEAIGVSLKRSPQRVRVAVELDDSGNPIALRITAASPDATPTQTHKK